AERYPAISPDNKSVAYFSDETGEYMLHVRSLATDVVKKISIEPKPSFYFDMVWSPDSKKLVFPDRRLNLWLVDVESGTAQKIDTSTYSAQESWQPDWSPDSRFLTYAKRLKNRAGTVFIYDLAAKKSVQITDGITHTESPVFDKNGKYLYFISSPNALTSEFKLGILSSQLSRSSVVRSVHALLLSKDTPSPVLPDGKSNADAKASETAPSVKIDFETNARRFVDLPLPPRDYAQLVAGKSGKLLLVVNEWSKAPGNFEEPPQLAVYLFNLASPEKGLEKIVDGFDSVEVTRDGNRILYQTGDDFFLTGAEAAAKPDEGKLNLSKMEIRVDPAEEWRQMLHESMRQMRDWFYDPNYHGQNLNKLEKDFTAYLPTVTRRADLNRLMQQMLGSVSVGHLVIGGGDAPLPAGNGNHTGLLGADYAIENGHYRFKKIYRSTSYSAANGKSYAPLDQPGIDVKEGDYLLEVNGNKLDTTKNLFSYFENTAGKPVKIVVSLDASDGVNSKTVTVYPAAGENRLRLANWAENNRRLVEKMSGGRLGYIFIEGYLGEGTMNAIRGLTGYADKQGIIIDQRYNAGGYAPDYLIEWMRRKPLYYYLFRGGEDLPAPANPAPPVKVMIVNERNGSAAETAALMFKLGKVGSIVGKRTAGAGIGPYFFTPSLIDGGRVQLPNRAAYNPDGSSWGIENYGVSPDFDVEMTPQDLMAGRDTQLEKAIEVALAQIVKEPIVIPKHPAFPIHPGK
ncbi:MAG: PDZ domain-containing protein, partial [Acidobacteria bacterium]|nr:PDZ domain-containing protein [Acidobacteriota bacterium]